MVAPDDMIQKKICMLGTFAVGKTSLVRRFVYSIFSDGYRSTLGVKIDRAKAEVDGTEVNMVVWDIQGEDDEERVLPAYLKGAAGYLLVIDPTRKYTLKSAMLLKLIADREAGEVPFIILLNKYDLKDQWEMTEVDLAILSKDAIAVLHTSAKTGENVDEAFHLLASTLIKKADGESKE